MYIAKGTGTNRDRPINFQKHQDYWDPSLIRKINMKKIVIDINAPDKTTRWAFSSEQDSS